MSTDDDLEMAHLVFSPEEMCELFDDLYDPENMRALFGPEAQQKLMESLWPREPEGDAEIAEGGNN